MYENSKLKEENLIKVTSNNLARFLTSRNYWYLRRYKDTEGRFVCVYVDSPLFKELLEIYERDKPDTYRAVKGTKAQA